jgi:hypothetical protein
VVGDAVDRDQDRLHGGDASELGPAGGAGHGSPAGVDHRGAGAPEGAGAGEPGAQAANEILRKASAFFAQAELDRRPK